MRTRTFVIDGKKQDATLLAGITGLVKVYHISGHKKPWLYVNRRLFQVSDEENRKVMRFVSLRYIDPREHEQIMSDLRELCRKCAAE